MRPNELFPSTCATMSSGSVSTSSVLLSTNSPGWMKNGVDGSINLLEVASGQVRYTFTGHRTCIQSLAFSADGRLLAAASADVPVQVRKDPTQRLQGLDGGQLGAFADLEQ